MARGEAARRPCVGAVRNVIIAEKMMADGKWIEGLTPAMPIAEAAALALAARFEVVRHFLPLAIDSPYDDPEYIHQLRVGTRRAGAALRTFADCLPRKYMRSAKRSLRKLRRASGEARDWDVFLLGLTHSTSLMAATGRAALDFLAGYATGERSAAQAELVEAAAERGPTFVEESIALPTLAHEPSGDAAAANFGELAATQFGDLLKAFTEAATAKPNDPAAMHRLRILGKRLRYALELFSGCFPPAFEEVVYPAVERLQELLGGLQDATVGLERLSRLRDRIKRVARANGRRSRKGSKAKRSAARSTPAGRKAFQRCGRIGQS